MKVINNITLANIGGQWVPQYIVCYKKAKNCKDKVGSIYKVNEDMGDQGDITYTQINDETNTFSTRCGFYMFHTKPYDWKPL